LLGKSPKQVQRMTFHGQCVHVLRIEGDRVVETHDRLCETPETLTIRCLMVVCFDKIGVHGDQLAETGQRFIVPLQRGKHDA